MEARECGAAALAMVLAAHGHHAPLAEIREACGVSRDGLTARQIVAAARRYGLTADGFRVSPSGLAKFRHPVILHWEMNHFVVLEAWGERTCRIVDPAVGRRVISAAELDRAFTGVVVDLEPGPGFTRRPRRTPWLRPLLSAMGDAPGGLVMLLTSALAINVLGLALPVALQLVVDDVLPRARASWLTVLGPTLVGLVLLNSLFTIVRERIGLAFNARFEAIFAERFVRRMLRLPMVFFEQRSTGDLVRRVQAIGFIRSLLAGAAVALVSDGLLLVCALALMWIFDVRLALLVAGASAVYVLVFLSARSRQSRLLQEQEIEETRQSSELVQILWGLPTLKAGGSEAFRQNRWTSLLINELNAGHRSRTFGDRIDVALAAIRMLTPAAVLLWGARLVLDGELTLGVLIGFQFLQVVFLQSLAKVFDVMLFGQSLPVQMDRLSDVLATDPEPTGNAPCPPLAGNITVEHLNFAYSGRGQAALSDVSFEVAAGQKVAIVGASGSGKSTLLKVLLGLHEPTAGRVLIEGVPLAELDRASVRRQMGVVLQDTMLFSGTIRENLCLSCPDTPLEDIVKATRAARIHDHIQSLPLGYDTPVSATRGALSGGQRQRLALARAILHRPQVILLDEATSALDPVTEAAIDEYFSSRPCTRIVIAHRLNTIVNADQILVLDGGRIVERGRHHELVALGGVYARLAALGESTPHEPPSPVLQRSPPRDAAEDEAMRGEMPVVEASDGNGSAAACLAALIRRAGRSVALARVREECACDAEMTVAAMMSAARAFGFACRQVTVSLDDMRFSPEPLILESRDRRFVIGQCDRRGRLRVMDPVATSRGELGEDWDLAYTGRAFELRPESPSPAGMATRVRSFIVDRRGWLGQVLLAVVVLQAASLGAPLLAGILVDNVIVPGDASRLALVAIAFAAVITLSTVHGAVRTTVMRYLRTRFDRELLDQMMSHLLALPMTFFDSRDPGALLQRFQTFRAVRNLLGADPVTVVLDLAVLNVAALALLILEPSLAWLVLGVGALSFLVGAVCLGPLRRLVDEELDADAAQQDCLIELLRGVATLRVSGHQDGGAGRWIPFLQRKLAARLRQERLGVAEYTILDSLRLGTLALLVWRGAAEVLAGTMSLGAFVSFYGIAGLLLGAITATASKLVPAAHVGLHLRRIREIFDAAPEQDRGAIRSPGKLSGRITFENVSFTYAGASSKALDAVSLEIEPGTTLAIVGASGAGKTTVGRLLTGFYRPNEGRILLDGKDLWGLDLTSVRRQLGVVLQDPYLFSGSIRQNVALGAPDCPVEEVWDAIRTAGVEREVAALPMKLGTFVAEAGGAFAGGQRQRLAIARAVLGRPSIVLFDEATSALDNLSQRDVQDGLAALSCTRLVIAHRLSTVIDADRIVVLDRGRIVEQGTHEELLAVRGHYARLMRPQMAEVM